MSRGWVCSGLVLGFASWLGFACGSEEVADDPAHGSPDSGTSDAGDAADTGTPSKISEQSFGAFEPWATPIEDFLAVGEQEQPGIFNSKIVDLAATETRLYIAYGDADYNLGEQIPIEFRFFSSKDDPTHAAANVEATGQGAAQTTPYQSGEEQIDRYRFFDGKLWQAGIDSIDADELHTQANTDPKAIQGNMYRLDGDVWKKFRSITGGEHVHDLSSWSGAIYGVGSGADTRLEFEAGQIFRYLWKSTDQGASFETAERIQHPAPGAGDTRWVTLVPTGGSLYLFGYQSTFATNSATISNAEWNGSAVTDLPMGHALYRIFPDDRLTLTDGTALLWGIDVSPPTKYTAGRVGADGSYTLLGSLADSTVLDAALTDTGEVLWLVNEGNDYAATPTSWNAKVLVSDVATPDSPKELIAFTTDVEPVSIAYWQGALFLGTDGGKVLRALPVP